MNGEDVPRLSKKILAHLNFFTDIVLRTNKPTAMNALTHTHTLVITLSQDFLHLSL